MHRNCRSPPIHCEPLRGDNDNSIYATWTANTAMLQGHVTATKSTVQFRRASNSLIAFRRMAHPVCEDCWDIQRGLLALEKQPGCAENVHVVAGDRGARTKRKKASRTFVPGPCSRRASKIDLPQFSIEKRSVEHWCELLLTDCTT